MLTLKVLNSCKELADEFERCCSEYSSLNVATAWFGDPQHNLPYAHLKAFAGKITATVGRSFNHTHPDGLDFLRRLKADLRVFKDDADLFHPKVYLFASRRRVALFIGSSNFTYSGFYRNIEINALLEGVPSGGEKRQIARVREQLAAWRREACSFVPSRQWLRDYRRDFRKTLRAERKARVKTVFLREAEIVHASWLGTANWKLFYNEVLQKLRDADRDRAEFLRFFSDVRRLLPTPWRAAYLEDAHKRGVIAGVGEYGWFGHVGASGQFKHLLANGTSAEKRTIVQSLNAITPMNPPIDSKRLGELLVRLVKLGPTMKVWSRLLCLVRPDLYCTVASIPVRKNLSKILNVPQSNFQSVAGYLELLKVIHGAPWFQSPEPKSREEQEIWLKRVAFIDCIFYI